jgi:2-polyprenyl-3-methyl-5-hydroxy-6-metoxy-1,4-benzoquinol methylase
MNGETTRDTLVISAFGQLWSQRDLVLLLNCVATLKNFAAVSCSLPSDGFANSEVQSSIDTLEVQPAVSASEGHADDVRERLSETDIAVCLATDSDELKLKILSAGVPLILLKSSDTSILPEDATISIADDDNSAPLLEAYLRRLVEDSPLRKRMGRNALLFTESRARSDASQGRFQKLDGIDYKSGAINYPGRLDPKNRHHLLTKPFYNLRIRKDRFEGDGLDDDTRRQFCDFANIAYELALPLDARILDVGCGPGWLVEYFARFGYDVTGLDISPELIAMAEDRLGRVPFGVDDESPLRYRLLTHDIESQPLIERFDLILCYDSLHHFEDEHAVMRNLAAMTEDNGLLFILEGSHPEEHQQTSEQLRSVMREFGTLESPFRREYLLKLLDENGFAVVGDYVAVDGLFDRSTIEDGRVAVEANKVNYILCKKVSMGSALRVPTSAEPDSLVAEFRIAEDFDAEVSPGGRLRFSFSVKNLGRTLWLASRGVRQGIVRFGLKLFDANGDLVEESHGEPPLLSAIGPGEQRDFMLDRRAPLISGEYVLKLDLLVQDVCWFEDRGSAPLRVSFRVR